MFVLLKSWVYRFSVVCPWCACRCHCRLGGQMIVFCQCDRTARPRCRRVARFLAHRCLDLPLSGTINSYRARYGLHTSSHHRCSGIFHSVYWYIFHVFRFVCLSYRLCLRIWRNVGVTMNVLGIVEVRLGHILCPFVVCSGLFHVLFSCRSTRRRTRRTRSRHVCLESSSC